MDITEMRMQAKMHLRNHKLTMIYVCLIIGLINFIPNVLPNTTIGNSLSLILILLLVPMNHGYVTSSLKFVRGLGDQVDEKKDGFIGILRFKDLFTTYFLQEVLSALPLFSAIAASELKSQRSINRSSVRRLLLAPFGWRL